MKLLVLDYPGHPFVLELSRELARRGHVVRHCFFAADAGPKGALTARADDPPNFSICPIHIRGRYSKKNLVRRHMLDHAYGRAAAKVLADFQPDVTLVGQTPANGLEPVRKAAASAGTGFVLWLQDVFGEAAATLLGGRWGGLGRLVASHYQAMETRVLRRADHIIPITDAFLPYLDRCGVDRRRVTVIPNWGPLSAVPLRPKRTPWAQGAGLADKLVFAYSGTLGLKHNPAMLYDLAKSFTDRPDVLVQVTCSGVGGEWLKERARQEPLANLRVLPLVPIDDLPDLYGGADVLVGLLESTASTFSAPSKVLAYLCAGRAVLLSAPAENASTQTLLEAGGGVATPAGDSAAFIAAAHRLADDPAARAAYGAAGRAYAERAFAIDAVAAQFEARLLDLAKARPRRAAV
jgi:colanic acid biosynthesis glycosyl transferase WcaI